MSGLIIETWPSTLPLAPQLEGYEETPQPNVVRTPVDAGRARQRRRYTSVGAILSTTFLFTHAQEDTFKAFYKDTLQNGAEEFNWYHPVSKESIVARFVGDNPPTYSAASHNLVRVRAQIEITRFRQEVTLIDATASQVLNPRVSFSRATTGTYWDANAVLQTAAIDEERIDYDPVTLAVRGLLVEEQRSNIIPNSATMDPADFFASQGLTFSASSSSATTTGVTSLIPTIESGAHYIRHTYPNPWDQVSKHMRFYAEQVGPAGYQVGIWSNFNGGSSEEYAVLDFAAGQLTSTAGGLSVDVLDMGGGVWRVDVFGLTTVDSTRQIGIAMFDSSGASSFTGDGVSGAKIWGWSLVEPAIPTSHIETTGSPATRAQDNVVSTIGGAAPSALSYDITGTAGPDQDAVLWQTDDGSEANRLRLERIAGSLHYIVTSGGVEQANLNLGALTDFTEFTVRIAAAANDFAGSLNGAASVTDATGAMPVGLTTRRIGQSSIGEHWNAWIKNATEYPWRLSNTELEA